MTFREWLLQAGARIFEVESEEPRLEAELLAMHALGIDRVRLYQSLQDELTSEAELACEALLARREANEPTSYIIGHREFFGLELEVTPDVLIPRPETETLVDLLLNFSHQRYVDRGAVVVDVGTGSGAIAVAVAHELPDARVIATDVSGAALAVARRNAERHGVADRIDFREGNLLEPVSERVDVIAANLPYVTEEQWKAMPARIREWEPRGALVGGLDGLDVIRRLFPDPLAGSRWRGGMTLAEGGALFCEIGDWQGPWVRTLATTAFPRALVEVDRDLGQRDRVVSVYW